MVEPLRIGYSYRPLSPERREIRILLVQQQTLWDSSPLKCRLEHMSLMMEPTQEYTAISYCWEDPSQRKPAIIDGQSVSIPKSADTALRYLISKTRTNRPVVGVEASGHHQVPFRRVWIDALCINQADTGERNEQVKIMGNVYASASLVFIWLGRDTSGFAKYAKLAFERVAEKVAEEEKLTILDSDEPFCGLSEEEWEGLDCFYSSLWFTRIWVVQEEMLARAVACRIGTVDIDWRNHQIFANDWLEREELFGEATKHMSREGVRGIANTIARERSASTKRELTDVLTWRLQVDASDPRDHIYALLGVLHDHAAYQILVDYNSTLKDIFTAATRKAIIHDRSLRLLDERRARVHRGDDASTEPFPSWVTPFHYPFDRSLCTARGMRPPLELSNLFAFLDKGLESILTVKGVIIDEIENEPPILFSSNRGHWAQDTASVKCEGTIEYIGERLCAAYTILRSRCPQMDQEVLVRSLAEVLAPGACFVHEDSGETSESQRETLMFLTNLIKDTIRGDKAQIRVMISQNGEDVNWLLTDNYGRSLISTMNGRFGMAFPTAQKGDKICHLFGSWKLLILRQQDEHWIFIGDVSLHKGTMHEDVMDLYNKGELEARSQWFDIC